jgi:ribosomal protein L40E
MAKIPEATERLFQNVFVCKRCKTKIKAPSIKIIAKKIACRKCGGKSFRAIKKGKTK